MNKRARAEIGIGRSNTPYYGSRTKVFRFGQGQTTAEEIVIGSKGTLIRIIFDEVQSCSEDTEFKFTYHADGGVTVLRHDGENCKEVAAKLVVVGQDEK